MGSRLVNPTREDQLMEVSSKSRLFTLKHLPFKCCLHMPHWEALQGEQKTKKQSFISSGVCHVEAASGCSVFFLVFFCVFFSCYYRVKAHSICFEFWFFCLFFILPVSLQSFSTRSSWGMKWTQGDACMFCFLYTNSVFFAVSWCWTYSLCFLVVFACAECCSPWREGMRVNKRARRRRVIRRALLCDMSICCALLWLSIIINSFIFQRLHRVEVYVYPIQRHGGRWSVCVFTVLGIAFLFRFSFSLVSFPPYPSFLITTVVLSIYEYVVKKFI